MSKELFKFFSKDSRRQFVTSAVRRSINADDLKKFIALINGEISCFKRCVVETHI